MSDINCTIQDLHYYLQDSGRVFGSYTLSNVGWIVFLYSMLPFTLPIREVTLPNPHDYMDVIVW